MNYDANSIETLTFKDAIRQRVAMYMGSADNQGVLQCIREIITNSIDEATMGYGNKIWVELFEGNKVVITDEARGCPFGLREDGTEALEAIYTMPHSGGKFNEKQYQDVAGCNGIGAKGTALSSDIFKVWSARDGQTAYLKLIKGVKEKFEIKPNFSKKTGTIVSFIPSQEVYNVEPIKIEFKEIKKMCRDWSYLMKGITFELTNHITNEHLVYCSKNGLVDFVKDNSAQPIHKTPLSITYEDGPYRTEIAMIWTNARHEESHIFTNGLENIEGGSSLTGCKTALTNFFKKKFKDEIGPEIARRGLFYAISCKAPNPSFSNQTKTKVNTPELRGLCQKATTKMLEDFELKHNNEFQKILEILTKEVKAEKVAERARKQVLEANKEIEKNQKRKVFASDKLKDAEFLGQDSTLLLCEGLSASSSLAVARDEKHFGILALRGKPINAFTNDDEKFYQNEEIKLLLSAMNITPGKYDSKKLRYGHIGICSDADADGYAIGLLIMCALYKVAPEFIEEGRLGWLRSPLYIVKEKNKESYYFTDDEFNEIRSNIKGEVSRCKGLGSLSSDQARNSMFSPEFQRIDQLIPDSETMVLLYDLMGDDSRKKHDFLFEYLDFSEIKE
jgi:DNA gyrase/topoisomerase IV subunit B